MPSLSKFSTPGLGYQTIQGTAGETIQTGDIVAVGNNKLYWLGDPNDASAQYKTFRGSFVRSSNTYIEGQTLTQLSTMNIQTWVLNQYMGDSIDGRRVVGCRIITLANGNNAIIAQDTNVPAVRVQVFSPAGVQVGSTITIGNIMPASGFDVATLNNGNIIVVWMSSTTGVTATVYDPTFQTVVIAPTVISISCGSYNTGNIALTYPQVAVMAGGNVVIITADNGYGSALNRVIITPTLTVATAAAAVGVGYGGANCVASSLPTLHMVAPVANGGGYVIAAGYGSTNYQYTQFASFSNTGVLGTAIVGNVTYSNSGYLFNTLDGRVVVVNFSTTTPETYNWAAYFANTTSYAGSTIGSTWPASQNIGTARATATTDNGWAIAFKGILIKFSNTIAYQIQANTNYDAASAANTIQLQLIQDTVSNNYWLYTPSANSANAYASTLTGFSYTTGVGWATVANTAVMNVTSLSTNSAVSLTVPTQPVYSSFNGLSFITSFGNITYDNFIQALSWSAMGVAQNGNTVGGTVTVQTQGVANTRLSFKQPVSMYNTGVGYATRLSIVGNTATMTPPIPQISRII